MNRFSQIFNSVSRWVGPASRGFVRAAKSVRTAANLYSANRAARNEARAVALLAVTHPRSIRTQKRAIQRAVETLNRGYKEYLVRNWYESGNPYSDGSRSYLPEVLTDARYDQNQITTREMMRRMRYWEQNSVFVKRGLDISEQYVIGTHMPVVTSLASNPDWQTVAENVFHEMCQNAGLKGESLFSMLCVGHRRKNVDGNILFVETSKVAPLTIRAGTKYETQINVMRPCYQMVEAHRIGTPFPMWAQEGLNLFDGVQYKEIETKMPDGQIRRQLVKTHYWINDSANCFSANTGFTAVPVDNCYYATSPHRVNEPRGVSAFYAAEPTLALLEDLLKLEMRAQEVQSDLTLFITNGAGQIVDKKMQSTLGALNIKVSQDESGNPVVTAQDVDKVKAVYEKIWGGRTAVGRTGDTLTPMAPVRPADATLNLWNFLIESFCAATGFPRILTFAKFAKGQGTEVRAELVAANDGWIKEFNLIWKPFLQQAWKYFIGWAIKNDQRLANAPADWAHIEVSPPRSVIVDLGYDSAADLAELAAGVNDLHTWAQKRGTTRSKIIKKSVADVFDIKLECAKRAENPEYKKYGITVDAAEVRNNLANVTQALAAAQAAEAQKQNQLEGVTA